MSKLTADPNDSGVRIGRLIMRGKTCEVKAAEPKESKSTARRAYQTQAAIAGTRAGTMDPRLMNKAYNLAEGRQAVPPHQMGAYDPSMQYGYAMGAMPTGYYHPSMGVYDGYVHPMYAQPMQAMYPAQPEDGSNQAPLVGTPMDSQQAIHPNAYYNPYMMYPFYHAQTENQNSAHNYNGSSAYTYSSAAGSSSVMQPATPGIAPKESSTTSK